MRQLLVLVILVLSACGDDSTTDDSTGKGNGAADIDRFIETYCNFVRNCCSLSGHPLERFADCEEEVERQIGLVGVIRAGKATLLQPEFDECIESLEAVKDSCKYPFGSSDSCRNMWKGTVQEGGACESVTECIRDTGPVICLKIKEPNDAQTEEGVCRQLTKASSSEACALDTDERLYGSTYSTPAPGPALAYCDRNEGLFCSFPEDVCKALPTEGERCDYDCAVGLYCDENDEICKVQLSEGEACESHDQCPSNLGCFESVCGLPAIGDTKICEGDYN